MKINNLSYLSAVLLLILTIHINSSLLIQNSNNCTCDEVSSPIKNNSFVQSDQIIDDINYNKSILIGNYIGLGWYSNTTNYSYLFLNHSCPKGTRSLSKEELLNLITNYHTQLYNYIKSLGIQDGNYIVTNTKASLVTDPSHMNSYLFYGAVVKSTSMSIVEVNQVYYKSTSRVLCFFDNESVFLSNPTNGFDFQTGDFYKIDMKTSHIQSMTWKIDSKTEEKGLFLEVVFEKDGEHIVKMNTLDVFNSQKCYCMTVYSMNYISKIKNLNFSTVNPCDVVIKDLKILAANENFSFFNRGNTSIAPKSNGGFYMSYTSFDYIGYILEFDSSLTQINSFLIGENAFILDITSVQNGFFLYVKYYKANDHSEIQKWSQNGKLLWRRNVMNNQTPDLSSYASPSIAIDQITFRSCIEKKLSDNQYQSLVMFANQSGKLSYGKGKASLIFSHYNFLGLLPDGRRNDQTGDSFFLFPVTSNEENNEKYYKYAWTWKTSHSLVQTNYYDGRHYITASLGETIRVCFVYSDIYNKSKYDIDRQTYNNNKSICFDNLVPGKFPTDGKGKTCGFLGGLIEIGDFYALAYSRKACEMVGYDGKMTSDYNNEVGVSFFRFDSKKGSVFDVRNIRLSNGDNVKGVKFGLLGDKALVLLTVTDSPTKINLPPSQVTSSSDRTEFLLIDVNGSIVKERSRYDDEHIVPVSDDLKNLSDGSLIWGFVNKMTNELKFAYIKPSSTSINTV